MPSLCSSGHDHQNDWKIGTMSFSRLLSSNMPAHMVERYGSDPSEWFENKSFKSWFPENQSAEYSRLNHENRGREKEIRGNILVSLFVPWTRQARRLARQKRRLVSYALRLASARTFFAITLPHSWRSFAHYKVIFTFTAIDTNVCVFLISGLSRFYKIHLISPRFLRWSVPNVYLRTYLTLLMRRPYYFDANSGRTIL